MFPGGVHGAMQHGCRPQSRIRSSFAIDETA